MNQILYTNMPIISTIKKRKKFKLLFFISIFLVITVCSIYILLSFFRNRTENISKKLIGNSYSIQNLYNNSSLKSYSIAGNPFSVIGLIEIPKINILYPILSETNDELLKIAPCRFLRNNSK